MTTEWQDEGILLAVRPHGEGGAILTVLTPEHGRVAAFVYGLSRLQTRGGLDVGSVLDLRWQARNSSQMGQFSHVEVSRYTAAPLLHDGARLTALQSACALCAEGAAERQASRGMYHGLQALLQALHDPLWAVSYIAWEIAFLAEIGFALDLATCAVTGSSNVAFVSPRTGCAVSADGAGAYQHRLLKLPLFLQPQADKTTAGDDADIALGLKLTGYFLEHWVFVHHVQGMPPSRIRLQSMYEKSLT